MVDSWSSHFAQPPSSSQLRPHAEPFPGPGDFLEEERAGPRGPPPTWSSLCCRLSSSCSKGHCSRFASSSSIFFLMIWFRLRCSRTRCSSGLLSTPKPLGWEKPSGGPNFPQPCLRATPCSDTNLHHSLTQPPWQPQRWSRYCPIVQRRGVRLLGLKTPANSPLQSG